MPARISSPIYLFSTLTLALYLTACGSNSNSGGGPPPPPATGEWTWMSGSNVAYDPGNFGTQGIASPSNMPASRYFANSWTDLKSNFWVMGGTTGFTSPQQNDLWMYNPATNEWTWMGDNYEPNPPGVYGQLGVAAATNVPGGRVSSVSWTDNAGNFWLFGGYGFDVNGNLGQLNDLWRYQPSTGFWTWMSGSDTVNASPNYGALGVAAATNVPGARTTPANWIDSSGNLWLFGGETAVTCTDCYLNDLWQFNPTTSEWTWVSGSNTPDADGVYGTLGTPAAGNVPGARTSPANWIDRSGNLWLFGGVCWCWSATNPSYYFNDLWKFNPSTAQWTWMAGSNVPGGGYSGTYGTLGVPSSSNLPGSLVSPTAWVDHSGNFWLFGGFTYDSSEGNGGANGLWRFNPSTGQWTWMGGSNIPGGSFGYGTKGVPSPSNAPTSRGDASGWIDSQNNLWLFGGYGGDSTGGGGPLNDLWRWQPAKP